MNYVAMAGYTDVLGEPIPEDSLFFLRKYPTEFIILRLSKISAMLFQGNNDQQVDVDIIKQAIYGDVPGFAGVEELLSKLSRTTGWFSPAAIAMLITDTLKGGQSEIVTAINNVEFAQNLMKTILIYNQLYYGRFSDENMETLEAVFKLEVMQQGYLRDKGPLKMVTLMKFAFISKFFDVHEPLKKEAIAYFNKVGLGNPWLFGKFFLDVLTMATAKVNLGKHILEVENMPLLLMKEFSLDLDKFKGKNELSLNMDVVPRPFYFPNSDQAIILDYSFFQYAIEQGFFYSFYQNSGISIKERFKNYNNFKSYIGLEFFEKFLVGGYLQSIFHHRNQRIVATEKYQDFIIRASSNDVFIFEVKMTDLHAKTVEDMDYNKFKSFLDDNFLSQKRNGAKNKGASQILRQIDHLLDSDKELLNLLGLKNPKRLNLYPIIISSDSNVNIAGVHHYVNQAFDERIGDRRNLVQSIKPLMIMHIDFIVKFFGALKRNPDMFSAMINGYIKNQASLEKKYFETKNPHNYLLSRRTFNAYLSTKDFPDILGITMAEMANSFDLNIVDFGI